MKTENTIQCTITYKNRTIPLSAVAAMREWIDDCGFPDVEQDDEGNVSAHLTPEEVVAGVDYHYDGGLDAFLATLEPQSTPVRSKHTPGPWHYDSWKYINPGTGAIDRTVPVVVTAKFRIAEMASDEGNDNPYTIPLSEAEANARLIAAAPDLLEACKQIKAAYAHLTPYEHGEEAEKALDAIDAAIAKAEGREA